MNDAHELTLEEFERRFMNERDTLSYRYFRGEKLDESERLRLLELNRILERLLPVPPAPSEDSVKAMEELTRILAQRR